MARRKSWYGVCFLVALAALVTLHLVAVAANPGTGPWLLILFSGIERRLQKYANVVSYQATVAGTGCVDVSLDVASVALDLSTKVCNGFACPPCFNVIAASNDVYTLTLESCSAMWMGNFAQMGTGMFANGIQMVTIINSDTNKELVVIDGAGVQTRLRKNSAAIAACTSSGNRLQFVSPATISLARYIFPRNTNSCPVGSSHIATATECLKVGDEGNRMFVESDSWADYPSGCYVWETVSVGTGVYFNTHPTGAAHENASPACGIDAAAYTP